MSESRHQASEQVPDQVDSREALSGFFGKILAAAIQDSTRPKRPRTVVLTRTIVSEDEQIIFVFKREASKQWGLRNDCPDNLSDAQLERVGIACDHHLDDLRIQMEAHLLSSSGWKHGATISTNIGSRVGTSRPTSGTAMDPIDLMDETEQPNAGFYEDVAPDVATGSFSDADDSLQAVPSDMQDDATYHDADASYRIQEEEPAELQTAEEYDRVVRGWRAAGFDY